MILVPYTFGPFQLTGVYWRKFVMSMNMLHFLRDSLRSVTIKPMYPRLKQLLNNCMVD